jgi:endonuclease/exonuclease/phosphatase (EEP) superfamily protein YafD
MEKQVSLVNKLLSQFADRGEAVLMGGDFNLVPSMPTYWRLSERNREYYKKIL